MEGLHRSQLMQVVNFAPRGEAPRGIEIGFAGVVVVHLRGEEFQHALRRLRGRGVERGRGQRRAKGEDESCRHKASLLLADLTKSS